MSEYLKRGWKYRLFSWLGRQFYRLRMKLEDWQFWIDGKASEYDPEED